MKKSELLLAVVQNAIDGIISIDERGTVEMINPSACRLFGYLSDEVIGNNVSMLMPPPDRLQHDHYLKRYQDTRQPKVIGVGRVVTGLKRDGTRFPLRLGVSEVKQQNRTFFVGFIHDLTEQKEVEARLQDYTQHLEELVEVRTQSLNETIRALEVAKEQISGSLESEKELGRLKSRFISMASHEFRTPLSTVQLSASLIDQYAPPAIHPEVSRHVSKIKASVTGLTAILNEFLEIDKLESGKITPKISEFNLPELCRHVVEDLSMLARPNQTIKYDHTGQSQISLDNHLLKNCLVNLITNAMKYSGDDAVIAVESMVDHENIKVIVSDNGIGIPKEDQKYLFNAFFRAHNTGAIPGTGLGLNIVARHVSLMGGIVSFKSNPGEGTIFTLTFAV